MAAFSNQRRQTLAGQRKAGWAVAVFVVACAGAAGLDDPNDIPDLNIAIVAFARERLGETVGSGECTSLVMAAYKEVGASRSHASEPEGEAQDQTIWGLPVERRAELKSGDVLEFRDVVFSGRRTVREGDRVVAKFYRTTMEHHMAIVEEVRKGGREILVLHQNAGDEDAPEDERRRVRRDVLRFADLKRGTVTAYRPRTELREVKPASPIAGKALK